MAHTVNISTWQRQTSGPKFNGLYLAASRPTADSIVTIDAELAAAIADPNVNLIDVAPGVYTSSADMVRNVDRTGNALEIRAQNPSNPPVFQDGYQNVSGAHHITFRHLHFVKDGTDYPVNAAHRYWVHDSNGACTNITVDNCLFGGLSPSDVGKDPLDATPDAAFSDDLQMRCFKFTNSNTHTYTLTNCRIEDCYTIGDVKLNGQVLIANLVVYGFYFDGLRIVGKEDAGRVAGTKIIEGLHVNDCYGVYEELTASSPHDDATQMFNAGGTNAMNDDVLFVRCVFNGGQLRCNSLQAGLSQTYCKNIAYIHCLFATKATVHGISLERGASGAIIQGCALVDIGHSSAPWIRLFKCDGEVRVIDSIFPSGFNIGTGANANLTGYELVETNNEDNFAGDHGSAAAGYAALFENSGNLIGTAGAIKMFTPKSGVTQGALTTAGKFKDEAHIPTMADAPSLTGGSGQITVDTINDPRTQSRQQTAAGGDIYTQEDVRYSVTGAHSWTEVDDITDGYTITSLAANDYDVQTRKRNSKGIGLWSDIAIVTVS